MGNNYGAAIGGVNIYKNYVNEKNERLLELQKARTSDDPLAVERAGIEADMLFASVTYARGVAELLLKIIQPVN